MKWSPPWGLWWFAVISQRKTQPLHEFDMLEERHRWVDNSQCHTDDNLHNSLFIFLSLTGTVVLIRSVAVWMRVCVCVYE